MSNYIEFNANEFKVSTEANNHVGTKTMITNSFG